MVVACLTYGALPLAAQSTSDTATTVKFGAFVDGYFAYDFNRPHTVDRAFTTQPARHNEFNVNLAYVEGVVSGPRVRGRLALQYGTSVQSNYSAEPRLGAVSGGDLARVLQEAVAGVKLSPTLWVDAGIYLSHIGSESWISRDNLTYTRSLMADYSPYYQAGVKLTWQATSALAAQLHIVNGWQNISETNSDKAIGARVDWVASRRVAVSAYNFIGNELADSLPSRLRVFQGASIRVTPNARLTLQETFDFGSQALRGTAGTGRWYGTAAIAHLQVTGATALVARVERYADPQQVLISTGTSDGLKANGASLGLDVVPAPRTLWRTEFRAFNGSSAVFPTRDGAGKQNAFVVTSLALTFP